MYACSAGLALGSLAFAHGSLGTLGSVVIGAALVGAAVASISIIRRSVQADELALIQELSQAIARDLSLARSFPRIQKLARRLVPWEHMGFARYDAATNEMELVARSEEHTSELQSQSNLVCRLLLEKKKHRCAYRGSR